MSRGRKNIARSQKAALSTYRVTQIQSLWAKHSKFTPKFGAPRSQSCGHRIVVPKYCSHNFCHKIFVNKFWSQNFYHKILVTKFLSQNWSHKIWVTEFWSQNLSQKILVTQFKWHNFSHNIVVTKLSQVNFFTKSPDFWLLTFDVFQIDEEGGSKKIQAPWGALCII